MVVWPLNLHATEDYPMEEKENELPTVNDVTKPRRVLVVGNHDYILRNVESLLQKAGFETAGHTEEEPALDYIRYNPIDAVLIGGGVDPHVRLKISQLVKTEFPTVKLIEHFGGPATILTEVQSALG
jgi:PleD family two-component response regulator